MIRKKILAGFCLFVILSVVVTACAPAPTSTPVATPEGGEPTATPGEERPTPTTEPTPDQTPGEEGPAYLNPGLSTEERVEDLLERMTLAEKIGQMTQIEKNSISPADVREWKIGSVLSGGGGSPKTNMPEAWAEMVRGYKEAALETRLGIPLIYGVDAVHGHSNVKEAVIFPHNIGLGAARDVPLVEHIGRATAQAMVATNIYWNFGPVVAVPQDIRWGRTYEGYSEDTVIVAELGAAFVRGLQGVDGEIDLSAPTTALATPKHFVGDGGTEWGTSTRRGWEIDQGVTNVDEATLSEVHLPPYQATLDAGAQCVMASFSSWGGKKMHAQDYLLTEVLKGEMGFEGFVVSDWQGIDQIPGPYYTDVVTAVNAGIDMVMVPYDYVTFISTLTEAVENGDVPMERVDDAVRRILTVKVDLGLFERPFGDESLLEEIGSDKRRDLAREAVRKSLVLLKNEDLLPLAKDTPLVYVAGRSADDIGRQCGGWTIQWQGQQGPITPGTTILEGIEGALVDDAQLEYNQEGIFDQGMADVGIVVVGERPYAEGEGDSNDLSLSDEALLTIERVRETSEALVVILVSGRPMIVTDQIDDWDALVAAWLPGTEGDGVAEVLFGDYPFQGKLSYTWPRSMEQMPSPGDPLFPFGHGLTTLSGDD